MCTSGIKSFPIIGVIWPPFRSHNFHTVSVCELILFHPKTFIVRGRLYIFIKKKVSFDFATALCSIGAPDIPKNFAQRSEMENMVF